MTNTTPEERAIKAELKKVALEWARDNTGCDGHGNVGPISQSWARWFAKHAYRYRELTPSPTEEIGYYFPLWENGQTP